MIPAFLLLLTQQAASKIAETSLPERSSFTWVDVDGDGRLDLAAIRAEGTVQLLLNAGAGRFEDATERFGLAEVADAALLAWADYDADGRLDAFVGARAGASRLYHNEGGQFVDMSAGSGLVSEGAVRGAYWLDHDGDTRLDLVVLTAEKGELFRGLEGGFFEVSELPVLDGATGGGLWGGPVDEIEAPVLSGSGAAHEKSGGASLDGGQRVPGRPTPGGFLPLGPNPTVGSVTPIAAFPVNCANSVKDQANPGSCLSATSVPTAGMLFPGPHLGGVNNVQSGTNSFVGGGNTNTASGSSSTVSGGGSNTTSADLATVGGGASNTASGLEATVGGGVFNSASATDATVGGGGANTASGIYATIPGGQLNTSLGSFSFAAGRRAKANHVGAFVWGDGQNVDKTSSANDEFNVYAEGGARIFAMGQTLPSLVVDPAGSVGIGIATPDTLLHVNKGSAGVVTANGNSPITAENSTNCYVSILSPDASERGIVFGEPSSSHAGSVLYNTPGVQDGLDLRTNGGVTRMVVDGTGRVGVGTTTPGDKLSVRSGALSFTHPANDTPYVGMDYDETTDALRIRTNIATGSLNTTAVTVQRTSGNVGIGTDAPAFKLEVNGTAGKPGGGSWSASSDERLKKNVHDLEGALETLLALRGVSFEYKDPEAIHELPGTRIGFIAQEVEQVLPDWVDEGENGYKRLTVRGFEALAVEALRELEGENAALRARNDALEARVTRLEGLETELASIQATLRALAGTH